MHLTHFLSPVLALFITYLFIVFSRKVGIKTKLVDKPNFRKVHLKSAPIIGGISVFMGVSIVLSFSLFFDSNILVYKNIFIASLVLLIVGFIDDRFDLPAFIKLAVQLILAHFIFIQGIKIESLHGLFGIFEIADWLKYLLTISVITVIINAIKLMDAIDCLVASLSLLIFYFFCILAFIGGHYTLMLIFITFMGSLIAFLKFNLSKNNKIFMGGSGSLMLGFIIAVTAIKMLQTAISVDVNLILLGIIAVTLFPVFDALRVFRKRAKSGKSPLSEDKTHLHHLLLSKGSSHLDSTLIIISIIILNVGIGIITFALTGLSISILAMVLFFYLIVSALSFHNKLNQWKTIIEKMEALQ